MKIGSLIPSPEYGCYAFDREGGQIVSDKPRTLGLDEIQDLSWELWQPGGEWPLKEKDSRGNSTGRLVVVWMAYSDERDEWLALSFVTSVRVVGL